jgi:hypothetical protein
MVRIQSYTMGTGTDLGRNWNWTTFTSPGLEGHVVTGATSTASDAATYKAPAPSRTMTYVKPSMTVDSRNGVVAVGVIDAPAYTGRQYTGAADQVTCSVAGSTARPCALDGHVASNTTIA